MAVDTKTFITSSNLRAGAYDDEAQALTITFRDGRGWKYEDVPQGIWEGLKAAASAGKYFHQQIKDSFDGREV